MNEYLKKISWTERSYYSNVHHYLLKIKEKKIIFLNVRFLKYSYSPPSNISPNAYNLKEAAKEKTEEARKEAPVNKDAKKKTDGEDKKKPLSSSNNSLKKPFYQSNKFILSLLGSTVFVLGFALFFFKSSYIFNKSLHILF